MLPAPAQRRAGRCIRGRLKENEIEVSLLVSDNGR
jgi:hypothetical protein